MEELLLFSLCLVLFPLQEMGFNVFAIYFSKREQEPTSLRGGRLTALV